MKRLVWFWNLIHYCLFEIQLGFYNLFKFINPLRYILKTATAKKAFEKKRGIKDISDHIDEVVFSNNINGPSITWAGMHMSALIIGIEFLCFNLLQILFKINLLEKIFDNDLYGIFLILTLFIIGSLINYFTIFKEKKYLPYFDEFNKLPKNRIRLYCILCLIGYLSIEILVVVSFTWFRNL